MKFTIATLTFALIATADAKTNLRVKSGVGFCSYPMWSIPDVGTETRCDFPSGCPKRIDSIASPGCSDAFGVQGGETCVVRCASAHDGGSVTEVWRCSSTKSETWIAPKTGALQCKTPAFLQGPVKPIACAADVAKIAADAASLSPMIADITAKCDKTVSDDCVVSLNGFLSVIDSTLIDATKAFGDCSDGSDSACNTDLANIISLLSDTSNDLETVLTDCVHPERTDIQACMTDAIEVATTLIDIVQSGVAVVKDCTAPALL